MGHRIGRLGLALVAGCLLACSHPGGSSSPTGSAGTSGAAGNSGSPGSGGAMSTAGTTGAAGTGADTGVAGTSGGAGDVGTGSAGTTGAAGDGGPGVAGVTGAAGNSSGGAGTTGDGGNGQSAGSGGATGGTGNGANLIANGDLSDGATNWHTEMGTGNVNGGAYCVTNPGAALVGWSSPAGMPLSLSGGTSYRLSFQASGAGTVHTKVGLAVTPYTADFEGNDSVGSSLQTFTHTFMPTATDSNAGIAFTFMNAGSATVCIDNVTLAPN
jgi:hypothetical protein